MAIRMEKKRKIHTADIETGKKEGNFEEFVTKEGKDEASDHEHDRHNGRANCDLADVYSLEKYERGMHVRMFMAMGQCCLSLVAKEKA